MAETAKKAMRGKDDGQSYHFAAGTPVSVCGNNFFASMPVEPSSTNIAAEYAMYLKQESGR